ncbi:MAG TPA: hypothetical protein VFE82_18595 [Ramlibacter sp.]|jgi:hypothetical protein|uniref:hypothetical protein n=1 Tax=Ramlibacter sp. TaxID=1917967 RepID=UPI002D5A3F83|nr:hypothetical protein [Ramlibacter sp.]HZY20485.1 hypothetical protein [Ramlibacter sp.]
MSGITPRGPVGRLIWQLSSVLLLATVALVWTAMHQLRDAAREEAQARAQLVADAVASRIERAVAIGIPLTRLEGVEALFAQRMRGGEPAALALLDVQGRQLWVRSHEGLAALPAGPRTSARVAPGGQQVASVVVVWRDPGVGTLLRRWGLPLAALAAALAVFAAEAVRDAWATGPAARADVLRRAGARVALGDLRVRLARLPRREFDPRVPWLQRELRFVREQFLRIERLVQSLRTTEPEAARRALLDQAQLQARADDLFDEDIGPGAIDAAGRAAARARWCGLVAGVAAWLAAALVFTSWNAGEPLRLGATAALLLGTGGLVARMVRRMPGCGPGLVTGLALVGPGVAIPSLLLAVGAAYERMGAGAEALLVWVLVATALRLALALQRPEERSAA